MVYRLLADFKIFDKNFFDIIDCMTKVAKGFKSSENKFLLFR